MRRIATRCAVAGAALWATAALAAAHADAAAWTAPVTTSTGIFSTHQQVAMDEEGNVFAIWQNENNVSDKEEVQVAMRPAGGEWPAPSTLSPAGEEGLSADIAVNASGEAVAVWETKSGGGVIEASARPPDGSWQSPHEISPNIALASEAHVAIGTDGVVGVVWSDGLKAKNRSSKQRCVRPTANGACRNRSRMRQACMNRSTRCRRRGRR